MRQDWRGPLLLVGNAVRDRFERHRLDLDESEEPGVIRERSVPRGVVKVLKEHGRTIDGQLTGEALARQQHEAYVKALYEELGRAKVLGDQTLEAAVLHALRDAGEEA